MEAHKHDGIDSEKIKVYNVIPTYEMTSAQLTTYLSKKAINGEEFNVYISDTLESAKYVNVNNVWTKVGAQDLSVFNTTASNNLKDSANTERSVGGNNTQIMKSIKIYGSGTVRLKVDWYHNPSYSTQGFWYKNGVAMSSAVTDSTTYITITTDMTISMGDSVQFCIVTYQTNSVGYCKNFRVYYDKSPLTNQVLID